MRRIKNAGLVKTLPMDFLAARVNRAALTLAIQHTHPAKYIDDQYNIEHSYIYQGAIGAATATRALKIHCRSWERRKSKGVNAEQVLTQSCMGLV